MKKFILFFSILTSFFTGLYAQVKGKGIEIAHLTDNFYVYTTYHELSDGPYPSNSLYLVTDSGVVMFDTPWDSTQFQPFMDTIERRYHKPVVLCIATHFHADRTAGLEFLKSKGVATYSSKLTYDLCKEKHEKQAQYFFTNDTTFNVGGYVFRTYYGGPGHTTDNIVIWFEKYRILYGGCLIKSSENTSLGYVGDANIAEWPNTIHKIMKQFPEPAYIIPGHLSWAGTGHLKQTLKLLREYKKSN
jgi:metallo-beta-lactamase class B